MIIDIGGGTSDIAVISLGGIVKSKNLKVAGDQLNNDIISYMRDEFKILVGERTAEMVKIAIGSAGLWGKGFQMGTQTQLKFLPEVQSDFLFAAFVEEWGLLAGILVVLTFLLIIFRMVIIGSRARSNDFKFIALGGGLVLLIHFFINIGSNLGLLPVAGMPFPFLSYGGSSLWTNAILISIIQHIKLESAF